MLAPEFTKAWVFPGVGVKPSGQEVALIREFPAISQEICTETERISGRDVAAILERSATDFPSGLDEQLASFCFACTMVEILRAEGLVPEILAGNSFGVYPAVWAAGALDFAACVQLLTRAYRHMEIVAQEYPSALCAIVGLESLETQSLIITGGWSSVVRINSNNHTCHIYCGLHAEISDFSADCLEAGALSAAILPMALPYHHPEFTAGVKSAFAADVGELEWRKPRIPIFSTLEFRVIDNAADLADFVSRQIFQPIDWATSLAALYQRGVSELHECGLGISLTQNARFIEGMARWHNCRTISRWLASRG